MKCQRCEKPATFHITELTGGKPVELHLCEDHAREYLTQAGNEPASAGSMAAMFTQQLAKQMALGQTAEELADLDQQSCPYCGITFYDFRTQGRLGCPYDYVFFEKEIQPLLLNIHGESQHTGKRPTHSPELSRQRTELIRYRRQLQEAIREEHYELASRLRDKIREIEESS